MDVLHLKNVPILQQLQIEEALLRLGPRNLCLINEGSPPAIVMGISGKVEELVDLEKLKTNPIPVLKRFSGGGTVVVDDQTVFVSFLCKKELHPFAPYPEAIMRWTEELYREVFQLDAFALRENDYVIGEKKCGGNAQYLRKNCWLHHTTFLWDYRPEHMELLLHPKKTPNYRERRSHDEFLTRLKDHLPSKQVFIERLKEVLKQRFEVTPLSLGEVLPLLQEPHRRSTQELSLTTLI